jgi:hypothetical protein
MIIFLNMKQKIISFISTIGCVAGLVAATGCTQENPEVADDTFEVEEAESNGDDLSLLAEESAETEPAPPPARTEMPFTTGAVATTPEGIPTEDSEGERMDTVTGLQRAVEYYQRVLRTYIPDDEEAERLHKPVPPLTDLQQLVTYRIIRAVPEGPEGKKYVYDATDGRVKLVAR